ncbi:MAG: RagB/SusD family nutrient uptake outer membrane protein [Bacteroidales bacterium]
MKRKYIVFTLALAVLVTWSSCKQSFLDVKPAGGLDQNILANKNGLDALLVGAYSMLPGTKTWNWTWEASSSNWVFGSIRGMEANKGTDSGDQPDINPIQTFSETATNPYLNLRWRAIYEGVSRCNNLITVTNKALTEGAITQDEADSYIAQARVLRGWYHFEAWRMWEKIPYVDENTDPKTVKNDVDARPLIIADLQEGVNLPKDMGAVGKFNKTVAQVILGKAMMQMNHDYAGALPILQDAATNGTNPAGKPIGLMYKYGDIFDIIHRNDSEAIYTVQYSVNDGSGAKNGGDGEVLNFPYKGGGSPGGCCGFFNPTQDFVNSFRTSGGLPLLDDSYDVGANVVKNDFGVPATIEWKNNVAYKKDAVVAIIHADLRTTDFYKCLVTKDSANNPALTPASWSFMQTWAPDAGKLDPRLDWSVGRKGIPYWDWGIHTGADWIRDQTYSGPYSPKKQVYKKSQEGTYTEVGNWTSGWTANGYRMIRYADLLLLIAECQAKTGANQAALDNINKVRARAAHQAGWITMSDGSFAADYDIALYPTYGTAPVATNADVLKALYMERKLELGQEGHRYFDLNRWGTTVTELSRLLGYEKTNPWGGSLYGSASVGAEDVTYPIPQRQIDLSVGNLVQNR